MYAKITANNTVEQYPYLLKNLKADFPNTSFPVEIPVQTLADFGVVEVQEASPPQVSHTQFWQEIDPVLKNGVWKQTYVVSDLSAEDLAIAEEAKKNAVRDLRNEKLAATDWRVIKHLELNENIPAVWELYRQALRDVPQQAGFPWEVTWPNPPKE